MLTVLMLLSVNGCCETKYVYVDRYVDKPCPTIVLPPETNTSVMDEDVTITIYPL